MRTEIPDVLVDRWQLRIKHRENTVPTWNALALLVFLLLPASYANATNQGITGKKLLLKSPPKFVLLSKDASISIAGSDPVNGSDSSLSFDDGSGPVTFALPVSGWSANGSATLFKYKNTSAPGGPPRS